MDNRVDEFIESGILEAFVTGATSEDEEREVLHMKKLYPAVKQELDKLEQDMETLASRMAVPPPPNLWIRIEDEINGLTVTGKHLPDEAGRNRQYREEQKQDKQGPEYIEVEGESTHMRIHKAWKWVFAAVFVLGKIFLGFAIYYYLENRQMKQNMLEIKQELKELRGRR